VFPWVYFLKLSIWSEKLEPLSQSIGSKTNYDLLAHTSLMLQSRTIIVGTFDTSEDGTPSPVQRCTNRWLFGQKIAHFLVFSALQRGEGGEVGKVSQDY